MSSTHDPEKGEWKTVETHKPGRRRRKNNSKTNHFMTESIRRSKEIQKVLIQEKSNDELDLQNNPEQAQTRIDQTYQYINACIDALEKDKDGFFYGLWRNMIEILFEEKLSQKDVDNKTKERDNHDDSEKHEVYKRDLTPNFQYDIVCYGIGNFGKAYSAPMLQLACVILIRKYLSTYFHQQYCPNSSNEHANANNEIQIYYYEPVMTQLEQVILENRFSNIIVISNNERGKRHVTNPTLFYMPHCPMRLYNNVLWANWYHIFPQSSSEATFNYNCINDVKPSHICYKNETNSNHISFGATLPPRILFFGNSFEAYHDRFILPSTSSSNDDPKSKDIDPTDGMLLALPFCVEKKCFFEVGDKKKKKKALRRYAAKSENEILWNMERAFNDCSLVYFDCSNNIINNDRSNNNGSGNSRHLWPDRPLEYLDRENHSGNDQQRETHTEMQESEII